MCSLKISDGNYLKTVKDTQNLRQRYRKPSRRGFQIISYMFNLNVKQTLANQICCVYVYNYPKRQKMPKRVKMFTSKWHRKQQHFFIHPFRSLQCIWFLGRKFFVENKLTKAYLKWGRGGGGLNFQLFPLLEPPCILTGPNWHMHNLAIGPTI